MKFVLVLVLLACALSLSVKDRMETATAEYLRAEMETHEVLSKGCQYGECKRWGTMMCCNVVI